MKKVLIAIVIIAAILLTAIGGNYTVSLFKEAGANMITIKGVVGCYIVPGLASLFLALWAITKIEER